MSEHEQPRRADDLGPLQELVEAVRADAPEEPRWQIARRNLMERLHHTDADQSEGIVMRIVRKARSKQAGWAATVAAAAAVVVLIITLFPWHRNGGLAFADVQEQIRTFRAYACTRTTQYEGKPAHTARVMRLSRARRREIWSNGDVLVFDLSQAPNRSLRLMTERKAAIEKTYSGTGPRSDPDLLGLLGPMRAQSAEQLGVRQIDGRTAEGFHLPDKVNDFTVWADPRTGLPVRIELRQPEIPRTIVFDDFDFGVDFDESLFSTTAPEGYTVQRVVKDGTTPREADLIEGLRAVAEFLNGSFPPTLEGPGLGDAFREHLKTKTPSPTDQQMQALGEKLQRAIRYVDILEMFRGAKNLRYVGAGTKLGDSESPVLWWQPKAADTYRVVYGDLSVKDVAPGDLPSLEQAVETGPP